METIEITAGITQEEQMDMHDLLKKYKLLEKERDNLKDTYFSLFEKYKELNDFTKNQAVKLLKKNEELEKQIKKMRNCRNCKNFIGNVSCQKYRNFECMIDNYSKWELDE